MKKKSELFLLYIFATLEIYVFMDFAIIFRRECAEALSKNAVEELDADEIMSNRSPIESIKRQFNLSEDEEESEDDLNVENRLPKRLPQKKR